MALVVQNSSAGNSLAAAHCYSFISDTELAGDIGGLAGAIAADSAAQAMLAAGDGLPTRCLADLKIDIREDGSARLRRFYWSVQQPGDGAAAPFAARTLCWYRKEKNAGLWIDFPHDPDLPGAGQCVAEHAGVRILRYVPLRRLTFSFDDGAGGRAVAKIKRRDRFAAAAQSLRHVGEAVKQAQLRFDVPRLSDFDPGRAMFVQSHCEGAPLSDAATLDDAPAMLEQAGGVLGDFHTLSCAGLARHDSADTLAAAAASARWVSSILPQSRNRLMACIDALARTRRADETPVLCHGDFAAGQLLVAKRWSLVDFDLIHAGSRYGDIANMLASLRAEAACFATAGHGLDAVESGLAQAREAFLSGYARAAPVALDHDRLDWHIACAELHQLMLTIRKDRYTPSGFAAGLGRIERGCALAGGGSP